MKKIFGLLTAAVLFAGSFALTGCDEVADELSGPEKTWCSMPVTYANDDESSTANIYVHFYFSTTEVTSDSTASKALKKGITIAAALTVVVTSAGGDQSSIIAGLTSNAYIMKTFALDSETAADDGDNSYTVTGSREKWSAIYWLKSDLRQADNQDSDPPAQLSNGGNGTGLNWDSIKDTFSWKRLLANYLLDSL